MMEHLNYTLFMLLNAAPGAPAIVVDIARFWAEGVIWLAPAGLIIGWLRC